MKNMVGLLLLHLIMILQIGLLVFQIFKGMQEITLKVQVQVFWGLKDIFTIQNL